MTWLYTRTATVWLAVFSAPTLWAEDPAVDALLKAREAASSQRDVKEEHQAVFTDRDLAEVQRLRFHESNTIALRAAWEVIRRSIDAPWDEQERLPPVVVARFLGFAEGRIRCEIPEWWQRSLEGAVAWYREEIEEELRHRLEMTNPKLYKHEVRPGRLYSNVEFKIEDDHYVFRQGDLECRVPKSIYRDGQLRAAHAAVAHFHDGKALVGFVHGLVSKFQLHLVDCETSTIEWTTPVWAKGYWGGGGWWFHAMEVVVHDGRVYVFGMGIDALYIECFELQDGKNVFRFDTWH